MKLFHKKKKSDFWDGLPAFAKTPANPLIVGWYSLDGCLSELIIPALDIFIANHAGYPGDLTEQEWTDILTKIRAGFVAHRRLCNFDFPAGESAPIEKEFQEGINLFAEWYGHLWS